MGLGQGGHLIGKDLILPTNPGGWHRWQGQDVVVEGHAINHRVMSRLDTNHQIHMAKHHHAGVELDEQTTAYSAMKYVSRAIEIMASYGVILPGSTPAAAQAVPPASVEFIFESTYDPRAACMESRRAVKDKAFSDERLVQAAIWPDCCTRRSMAALKDLGVIVTDPVHEADGPLAAAARAGKRVFVLSEDSDILAYPLGTAEWEVLFPAKKKGELLIFDATHKTKIMATHFGITVDQVAQHRDRAEIIFLVFCLMMSHDYHTVQKENGKFSNSTGVGAKSWPPLFKLGGGLVKDGGVLRWNDYRGVVDKTCNAIITAYDERNSASADPDLVKAFKDCGFGKTKDTLIPRVKTAVDGFMQQMVPTDPGRGSVPYCSHCATPSQDGGPSTRPPINKYCYEGKCDECPAEYEAVWTAPDVEMVAATDDMYSDAKMPKLLLREVVAATEAHAHKVDWGGGDRATFDKIVGLFGRAAKSDEKVMVGTVDPTVAAQLQHWPPKHAQTFGGKELMMFVVEVQVIQSCGTPSYTKEDHREGDKYKVKVCFIASKDDGRVVTNGYTGLAGTGIIAVSCKCKSPFEICNHVLCAEIVVCRAKEADLYGSTDGSKYWRTAAGSTKLSGKYPLKPHECMVHRSYLNEILGVDNITVEEAQEILLR